MAAPGTEKSDQASKVESPPAAAVPPPAGKVAPAVPPRRRGRLVARLFYAVLLMLVVLGVAGYGALILRDTDPRVGAAANYVDEGLSEAQSLYGKAQEFIAGLTGGAQKTETPRNTARLLEKAPLEPAPPPQETQPTPEATPGEAARDAEKPAAIAPEPGPQAAAPEARRDETVDARPGETTPVETKPAETKPAEAKSVEAQPIETAPAPATPTPAVKAGGAAVSVDADGFTDRDLISALEGRIDALGDEVKALRERLDAPKNETRAAPEAETPRPTVAAPGDASAAAVVLAFALQRELEAGRPFSAEIAAFSRLGTEPAPAPTLVEIADKGAPTGPQLREAFLPVSKKLRAHESRAGETGALTDHLLQGASKLVKVRPAGEAQPETLDGKLDRIEAALAHNDFAAAVSLFDSLPEAARAEAGDFGARLRQRHEAAVAADDLLSGAIAALGKK